MKNLIENAMSNINAFLTDRKERFWVMLNLLAFAAVGNIWLAIMTGMVG